MRSLTKILLTGALVLAGTALAEAQQTTCTRIGNMVQCNTMPSSPYVGQPSGPGETLRSFSDTYLRAREQFSREDESAARTELLRQQTELLRRQNEQRQAPAPPAAPPARGGKSPEQAASYCYEQVKKMGFNSRDIEDRWWEDCTSQFRQQIGGRP